MNKHSAMATIGPQGEALDLFAALDTLVAGKTVRARRAEDPALP